VNPVEGESDSENLARSLRGSELSEVVMGDPESKSSLVKAGFYKRGPSEKLVFL
jgi:hypothetical protein